VQLQTGERTVTPPPDQTERRDDRRRGGDKEKEAKQPNKRPKRRHTTSLGPLVSFFFSFHYFVTNKPFWVLTRTADDEADPAPATHHCEPLLAGWIDNKGEGGQRTTMAGQLGPGQDNDNRAREGDHDETRAGTWG
jgi:hypothetical protein